ncbi:hypothetical protein FJZ31_17675 [Candidatus Poribacteria bacterium]|nr:hypothetical protein [Candidatus Poribacteria bacterium]
MMRTLFKRPFYGGLFLAITVFGALLFPERFAIGETIVKVDPSEKKFEAGSTCDVDILVENVEDLAGFEWKLVFTPNLLETKEVKEGEFLKKDKAETFFQGPYIDNELGSVSGVIARITSGGVTGSGTLLSLSFKAKLAGSITFYLQEVSLVNPKGRLIPRRVEPRCSGDVIINPGEKKELKRKLSNCLVNVDLHVFDETIIAIPSFIRFSTIGLSVPGEVDLPTISYSLEALNTAQPGCYDVMVRYEFFNFFTNARVCFEDLNIRVEIPSPDFSLSISPYSRETSPEGKTDYTVEIFSQEGFNAPVTLDVVSLPSGPTGNFVPNPVTPPANGSVNSTLTVSAPTLSGTYTLSLSSMSGTLQHTIQATLLVKNSQPPWDVNDDNLVDIRDVILVANHFGESDSIGDINNDGKVDIADLVLVGIHFEAK